MTAMTHQNSQAANYDVIVIGGGASGMMAASIAASNGARVAVVEKNKRLGQKLSITGGGRCNIFNAEENNNLLLANYGLASKFLHSAFARFGMQATADYFHKLGLPTKLEARKRAFPASESAPDVVKALYNDLRQHGVDIMAGSTVTTINAHNSVITSVSLNNQTISAKNYILATGGRSRPETGSTGDGFTWLADMGHTVRAPTPNVTPLAAGESWLKTASGTTIPAARIRFFLNSKPAFSVDGDILLTHFGVSGPTILNNAYRVAELLEAGDVTASINCFPKQTKPELDTSLQTILHEHPAKNLQTVLRLIAPPGLHKALAEILEPHGFLQTNNSELSKKQRLLVVELLMALPLTIERLMGFEKAVVADGGLSLTDIDTRTMRSKKITNLYITGDLLDINRPSGGYSLQLCWTTGYVAGASASES